MRKRGVPPSRHALRLCYAARVSSAAAVVPLREAQHGIRRTTGHRFPPVRFGERYCGAEHMEPPGASVQAGGAGSAHDG